MLQETLDRDRSPLELMMLGDRERIHTGFIHWILGQHSPLAPSSQDGLLEPLTGHRLYAEGFKLASIQQEYEHMDLVVQYRAMDHRPYVLVIENKITRTSPLDS